MKFVHQYRAGLLALFVTFLWSTSWVLIKVGLADVPPLTFAGLRYTLAFLLLVPFLFQKKQRTAIRQLAPRQWFLIALLGIVYYAVNQGAQFVALAMLPAVSVSLILNLATLAVTLSGISLLNEHPTPLQWLGVSMNLVGVALYFFPFQLPIDRSLGILVAFLGMLASAGAAVLGRQINRAQMLDPITLTMLSMGIGSVFLLGSGIAADGLPVLPARTWAIIGWLALVNTALAFTLWNYSLRSLSAMQSSIINSTMLVQIAALAWLFLGESISLQQGIGLAAAGTGALLAQLKLRRGP